MRLISVGLLEGTGVFGSDGRSKAVIVGADYAVPIAPANRNRPRQVSNLPWFCSHLAFGRQKRVSRIRLGQK